MSSVQKALPEKVLVTGGSGFIGRHVARILGKMGLQVVLADRHLPPAAGKEANEEKEMLRWELCIPSTWRSVLEAEYDVAIHLAWTDVRRVNDSVHLNPQLHHHMDFVDALLAKGVTVVGIGSCFEYGLQQGKLSEEAPLQPVTAYGMGKAALLFYLQRRATDPGQWKWLRPFFTYGPEQHEGSLIPQLEKAVRDKASAFRMSGGEQVRDYLHVERLAEYIARLSVLPGATGVFNICSGEPVKLKDFINRYLQERSLEIPLELGYYPYNPHEPMEFWGCNQKLEAALQCVNPA